MKITIVLGSETFQIYFRDHSNSETVLINHITNTMKNSPQSMSWQMTDTTRPLTGDFDPKNFLDQVETVDTTGRTIPEWRRHVLAKHAAEKAQKEFEERRVVRSSILLVGNKTNLRHVSAMAPVKKTATKKKMSIY